jgi:hypothetical protein
VKKISGTAIVACIMRERRHVGPDAPRHTSGRQGDARDDQICASGRSQQRRNSQRQAAKGLSPLVEDLKPEAGYFYLQEEGKRGGFFVVDMQESSQIAEIAERFFLGLNAQVELVPVMAADDLLKGLSSVAGTIQRYG